jgi:hypothetical protein
VIEAPIGTSVKYSIFAYSDANLEFRPIAKTLPYEVSVRETERPPILVELIQLDGMIEGGW